MWKNRKKHKSRLDNRLRELELEAETVRNSIRELSKVVERKEGTVSLPPPSSGAGVAQPSLQIASRETRDLVQNRPVTGLTGAVAPTLSYGGGDKLQSSAAPMLLKGEGQRKGSDGRFGHYLRATGLSSERPLRQERSLQRNKAIFMLVVMLIVLYVIIKHVTN